MNPQRAKLLILLALGVAGCLSLLAVPFGTLLPPEAKDVPRVAVITQPLILTVAAVFLGAWAAPKIGFDAPLISAMVEKRPVLPQLRFMLAPALWSGLAVAAVLLAYGHWSSSVYQQSQNPDFAALASFKMPLLTKLLYGGVSEELIARWGVMSAAILAAVKLGMVRGKAIWAGNFLAAFLFAAGHIPLLVMLMPEPSAIVLAAVLIGNLIPGLIFGWLYANRGLECAIGAHALGHLISTIVG